MSVEELIRTHVGYAMHMADRAVTLREQPDARSDAMLGLWEAAESFDPSRGVAFRIFALHRIRGAITDGRRARNGRRGQKDVRPIDPFEDPSRVDSDCAVSDCAVPASDYVDLLRAIERLPPVVKAVVVAYYWGDWSLLEIAKCLEVSESRLSQILTAAREHLRSSLIES